MTDTEREQRSPDELRDSLPRQIAQPGEPTDLDAATYGSGLGIKARSHWGYTRKRLLRHRLARGSFVVLTLIILAGLFANRVAP